MNSPRPFPHSGVRQPRANWLGAGVWTLGFVALLWVVEGFDQLVMSGDLDREGIRPGTSDGLIGILLAPFLHGDWDHLAANSGPLLVLGFLIALAGLSKWWAVTLTVWLVSGVGTWILGGAGTVHIGASGLVFGWLAYLVLRGFFTRRPLQILLGVVIFLVYGSMLWGVLPTTAGISWQGHLFGAIGGVLAAAMLEKGERRRHLQAY
ncbi:rhomboid family intramembrane serine protease [Nocardioides gilvus]|uniref:rhomboid family intramembrane serine protease n=1 Tax=Nocardioides gilvus TaxID=1735589 RepID=UPI001EF6B954|nr:rhomboid family intramembrane serine protease [Nocardioides gilvus]